MLKKLLVCFTLCLFSPGLSAQQFALNRPYFKAEHTSVTTKRPKTKPVMYNTLGYSVQLGRPDLVVGGTSIVYKKFGTFLSYKVGVRNWFLPENGQVGPIDKQNVIENNWTLTGNTQEATTFMISGGLTIPVTKRIPVYFGAGATRYRGFFEYKAPFDSTAKWNIDPDLTGWQINYTAGVMIPLGRFLINVGYDHNPQSIFIGIGISGRHVYEDVDEWWWEKKEKRPAY